MKLIISAVLVLLAITGCVRSNATFLQDDTGEANPFAQQPKVDRVLMPQFDYLVDEELTRPKDKTRWNTFRGVTLGESMTDYTNLGYLDGIHFWHKYGDIESLGGVEVNQIQYCARAQVITSFRIHFDSFADDEVLAILTNRFGQAHKTWENLYENRRWVDKWVWQVDESGQPVNLQNEIRYEITLTDIQSASGSGLMLRWVDKTAERSVWAQLNSLREIEQQQRNERAIEESLDDF